MTIPPHIKYIAFDADDTLWINEPNFRKVEDKFATYLSHYAPYNTVYQSLFEIHVHQLQIYGYGIKGFILSMLECALQVSNQQLTAEETQYILHLGKEMLEYPVVLIDGIENTLQQLSKEYLLVIATKGDLFDQEKKMIQSGLSHYFHHIEVMSEKNTTTYQSLLKHLDITANQFLMIGNSLKSDILPVITLGGYAAHIPFETTWAHETIEKPIESDRFFSFTHHSELLL